MLRRLGARGEERVVRVELPNGRVAHNEGAKGEERMVQVELPDGAVVDYEGEHGEEGSEVGRAPEQHLPRLWAGKSFKPSDRFQIMKNLGLVKHGE